MARFVAALPSDSYTEVQMKKGTNDVARLSIADRIHQSAFAALYPLAARLESLMGRKSDAAAVAVWHAGRLLVVEHSYKRGLTLPGGHIRSNEMPVLAAARELEEEVGLVIAPAEIRFFRRMEQRHTRLSLFECQLAREPEIRIDNREVTAAAFTAPAAISEPSSTLRSYLRAWRPRS